MSDLIDMANELAEWQLDMARRRQLARTDALLAGEGAEDCEDCGEPIPEARRKALPGCRTCVDCQSVREARRNG